MKNIHVKISVVFFVAMVMCSGCGRSQNLPSVRTDYVESRFDAVAEEGNAIYRWQGNRDDLKTYWGDQGISVDVVAYVPDGDWNRVGEIQWRAEARNAEGKPVPFLGVLMPFINELGTKLTVVVPPVEFSRLDSCLYVVLEPGIVLEEGVVTKVQPIAIITEVRRQAQMPFNPRVQLFPETETPPIVAPEVIDNPHGTPFGLN